MGGKAKDVIYCSYLYTPDVEFSWEEITWNLGKPKIQTSFCGQNECNGIDARPSGFVMHVCRVAPGKGIGFG